jgi:restriction endonuclease S subunit
MSDYPLDWHRVKIGNLLIEHSERSSTSSQHEVLSVTKDGIFSQREYFKKQIASEDNSGYKVVKKGDVVFSAMNLWMGSIDVVKDYQVGIVSPAYITMRPDENIVDTEFLGYFLRGDDMRKKYVQHSQQGASIVRRNLNKDDLLADEIAIPPLPEQKKIAEILSGVDSCTALIKLQKKKNEQSLERISAEIFERLTTSNLIKQLSDTCTLITKGATPTTFGHKLHETSFQGSVTFLGGGSTSEMGEFDLRPARHCTQDAVGTLKRSQLAKGDTLVTIVGASIGNTCQVPRSVLPANINQNVALVRSDEVVLDKSFLNLFLRTEGRRMLVSIATTQAQPSVSLAQVGQLQIPIPNLDEQRRIVSAVEGIRKSISLLDEKICKSQHLKEALSGDLLSGRKRVSI